MYTITADRTTVELHKVRQTFHGCTNSGMFDSVHRQVYEPTSKTRKDSDNNHFHGWWTTTGVSACHIQKWYKQPIFVEWATSVTGPLPILTPTYCHGLGLHPLSTWWYVYSCVIEQCQSRWRRNTDYIHVLGGEHLVCEGVTWFM